MTEPSLHEPRRRPPRWLVRAGWIGHRAIVDATGGRIGLRRATPSRRGLLRLRTLGRRSGHERGAILGYLEEGDDLVLLAANGMVDAPPAWWLNLRDTADAYADLPGGTRHVRAREARGVERDRLWARWLELRPELDTEAAALQREIGVVVLEPRGDRPAA